MKNMIKLELPENCRIITVSDIHTCWYLLDEVLKKAQYRPGEDYLVIVGDILEHWDQNLQTIEYVMKLCENKRVYCLMGNNDTMSFRMAEVYDYQKFTEKCRQKPCNTFMQMAQSIGVTEFSEDDFEEKRGIVRERFKTELDFIRNLPYLLETQNHIFVHAGIENRPDWENTSELYAITHPYWLREENPSGKWVVVGHFPCYNYRRGNNSNLPIIDKIKKMICIDGGLTIKHVCQLNALCITKNGDDYSYETVWDTFFEKKKVSRDHDPRIEPVYCDPYKHSFSLLDISDNMALVRNDTTGLQGLIPEDKLYYKDGRLQIWNTLNAFPPVKAGEFVHFCGQSGEYASVITESGQIGWVPMSILNL